MHIVVLGAGALGGYFGARWEEAGADVTFLVREKRAEQFHKYGLKVNSTQGDYTIAAPRVVTNVHDIEAPDLVFVSVKGHHLQGILENVKILTEKGAFVLPVLNGIEHINVLQNEVGMESVIGGLAFIMATLDDSGHVEHSSDFHRLAFGPLVPEQTDLCNRLAEVSSEAKMEAVNSQSILKELWKKYLFINAFSGITTATNLPIGQIRYNRDTFQIAVNILEEMQQLAASYNIEVTDKEVDEAKSSLLKINENATSSMHQDRRKGLTLEVDHLHGGAIRLAKAKSVRLPFIEAVHGIIKPYEGV
ncbi:ketopantoate reductase family protein [Virgibacillus doumboii]|uniref:ketopantoate reductase family protein n=1 Tax=Virgibacillus doumboii TaxID=2697503 RepID=UPI0013DFBBC8|nr:2-dehydropantoate 2-reductase [Virgibacillus doumboii]